MQLRCPVVALALALAPLPASAQPVEEVRTSSPDTPTLPEDLFGLPPDRWSFAKKLWEGTEPCTAEECEAGYTTGDLVISVERNKEYLRVIAGFRGCESVAWNEYKVGKKASKGDTRTIGKRIKKTVETSAKYCKAAVPAIAALDATLLYPSPPTPAS